MNLRVDSSSDEGEEKKDRGNSNSPQMQMLHVVQEESSPQSILDMVVTEEEKVQYDDLKLKEK